MDSLWFVVPAHGREALTKICLESLRWTCDELKVFGIEASAVVIADDSNLDVAHELGFWGYEQDNAFLGRKFNDGYELAAQQGVAYVVPLGSDDWIHPSLIADAPLEPDRIRCARRLVMVEEGGRRFMRLLIRYEGGIGMRIIPTGLMQPLGYRPAEEDARRGIDTVTLKRLIRAHRPAAEFGSRRRGRRHQPMPVIPEGDPFLSYFDTEHDWQIVDFKTGGGNLNTFDMCRVHAVDAPEEDPWRELALHYPDEGVQKMRALYEQGSEADEGRGAVARAPVR